jgi:hypothetical protein
LRVSGIPNKTFICIGFSPVLHLQCVYVYA